MFGLSKEFMMASYYVRKIKYMRARDKAVRN